MMSNEIVIRCVGRRRIRVHREPHGQVALQLTLQPDWPESKQVFERPLAYLVLEADQARVLHRALGASLKGMRRAK